MSTLTVLFKRGRNSLGEILAQEDVPDGGQPSDDLLEDIRNTIVLAIASHEGGEPSASCEIRVTI